MKLQITLNVDEVDLILDSFSPRQRRLFPVKQHLGIAARLLDGRTVKTDYVWGWMCGAPMDYTNWHDEDSGGNEDFTQLLRNEYSSYCW